MIDRNPIAEKFREADAILIGASNGLSITEGLHLFADNAAFERLLGQFTRNYTQTTKRGLLTTNKG